MPDMVNVYCDGGVILVNPSPFGGSWAWCAVDAHGNRTPGGSGLVTPADVGLPTVSNNVTELLAAVEAMEALPAGWAGTLHTDSLCTRCRLVNRRPSFKGIPDALRDRCLRARARLRMQVVLLDGHPTKKQLAAGVGKRGNPVSSSNVWCDRECGRLAARWLAEHPEATREAVTR